MTTTTLDIKTVGTTTTTSTRTHSTCDTIRGCRVNDDDWETTTKSSCSTRIAIRGEVAANPTPTPEPFIRARDDDGGGGGGCVTEEDVIIYLKDPTYLSPDLERVLKEPVDPGQPQGDTWWTRMTPVMVGDDDYYFVAFIYIPAIPKEIWESWRANRRGLQVSSRGTWHRISD